MAEDLMVDERLDVARAQALTRRLPLTLCVCDGDGQVHWSPHAALQGRCQRFCAASVSGHADVFAGAGPAGEHCEAPGPGAGEPGLLTRRLADGHILQFGLDEQVFGGPPVRLGGVLAVVLGLILAAWLYARHLLRPLEGINASLVQFRVPRKGRLVGMWVKDLRLPRGAVVSMIIRDQEVLIPNQELRLEAGDQLLLAVHSGLVERVQGRLTLINEHGPLARWIASGRNRRRLLDGD